MQFRIKKVAVLGSGVMGSGISCQLANVGLEVLMLDILPSKLSDDEKIIRLKEIGEKSVDIDGVGLYTLGKYRKTLNDSQKNEYKELFKNYFFLVGM